MRKKKQKPPHPIGDNTETSECLYGLDPSRDSAAFSSRMCLNNNSMNMSIQCTFVAKTSDIDRNLLKKRHDDMPLFYIAYLSFIFIIVLIKCHFQLNTLVITVARIPAGCFDRLL